MQYKAVFLDMDGTLLDRFGRISEFTKKSILETQKRGVIVAINSGRMPLEIERILSSNALQLPYIALNGAYSKDTIKHKVIFDYKMEQELCVKLLEVCNQVDCSSFWYSYDKIHANNLLTKFKRSKLDLKELLFEAVMVLSGRFVRTKHFEKIIKSGRCEILKCAIMCADPKQIKRIRNEFEQLDLLEITATAPMYLEFNEKGITKGKGMEHFLDSHKLRLEEAIAIGDHENDISMLQAAGMGVAMGNAITKVKEVADDVTDTNNHHGVAKVLYKYILK